MTPVVPFFCDCTCRLTLKKGHHLWQRRTPTRKPSTSVYAYDRMCAPHVYTVHVTHAGELFDYSPCRLQQQRCLGRTPKMYSTPLYKCSVTNEPLRIEHRPRVGEGGKGLHRNEFCHTLGMLLLPVPRSALTLMCLLTSNQAPASILHPLRSIPSLQSLHSLCSWRTLLHMLALVSSSLTRHHLNTIHCLPSSRFVLGMK